MLFLLNDMVLDLDAEAMISPRDEQRFDLLSFDYVVELGQELFSEEPRLTQTDPARARRLAWLIAHRQPGVNAALFTAPAEGCDAAAVDARFAVLGEPVLAALRAKAEAGKLNTQTADRAVWRRLAA